MIVERRVDTSKETNENILPYKGIQKAMIYDTGTVNIKMVGKIESNGKRLSPCCWRRPCVREDERVRVNLSGYHWESWKIMENHGECVPTLLREDENDFSFSMFSSLMGDHLSPHVAISTLQESIMYDSTVCTYLQLLKYRLCDLIASCLWNVSKFR